MIQWLRKAEPSGISGTALLRLDFNTEDEWRMDAAVPTVQFLLRHGAKVAVASHRGRPEGPDLKFTLANDAKELGARLGREVIFVPRLDFGAITRVVADAPRGSVLLLENLRFNPGEEENDGAFAQDLARIADYYVNDAFAVCHRRAASVHAITRLLPSYGGLELEQEMAMLGKVIKNPARPLVIILGGGKARDKLGVIKYLKEKADAFLLGGAPANTLLKIKGVNVGQSLVDEAATDYPEFGKIAEYPNVALPIDWVEEGGRILDIGENTVKLFAQHIARAATIVWSGPMGMIERPEFAKGSEAIARLIAGNTQAFTVAGGGETVMCLKKTRLDEKFGFISTGGGAMLAYLAGEALPGIEALEQ